MYFLSIFLSRSSSDILYPFCLVLPYSPSIAPRLLLPSSGLHNESSKPPEAIYDSKVYLPLFSSRVLEKFPHEPMVHRFMLDNSSVAPLASAFFVRWTHLMATLRSARRWGGAPLTG